MRRGVIAVDAAAKHGHGHPAGVKRAPMGLAVDPAGQTADDHEPGGGQLPAEHPRNLGAVRGARAGADDRHRGAPKKVDLSSPSYEQARRRVVDRAQERRKGGVGTGEPPNPRRRQPREVARHVERPFESDVGTVTRLADEVSTACGGEGRERKLVHVGPSSVGER